MATSLATICFSSGYWETSRAHRYLMEGLSERVPVLFVESLGTRTTRSSYKTDLSTLHDRARSLLAPTIRRVGTNLWVCSPKILPFPNLPYARQANAVSVVRPLKKWISDVAPTENPGLIVWVGIPTAWDAVSKLKSDLLIYHVVDDFLAFPWADRKTLEVLDRNLLSSADVVLAVSQQLVTRASRLNRNASKLAHGVHYEHFSNGVTIDGSFASRPDTNLKAGFMGTVDERIDWALMSRVAALLPHWSFEFAGRLKERRALRDIPRNIHFLGEIDYASLPSVMEDWAVFLVPYKTNDFARTMTPIKVMEYLAAGRPVVATSIPELVRWGSLSLVTTAEEFAASIVEEALRDSVSRRRKRRESVRMETWGQRVREASEAVSRALLSAGRSDLARLWNPIDH